MAKRIDITGKTYGHLTVRALADKVKGVRARLWVCDCDACDGCSQFAGETLRSGSITSCGCRPRLNLSGYKLVERMKKNGQRLCKSLPDNTLISDSVRFFLEPSGKVVRKNAAESAIAARELIAAGDGLFADTAQTWTAP